MFVHHTPQGQMKTVRKWNIKLQFKQQDFLFTTFYIYKNIDKHPPTPFLQLRIMTKKTKRKNNQLFIYLAFCFCSLQIFSILKNNIILATWNKYMNIYIHMQSLSMFFNCYFLYVYFFYFQFDFTFSLISFTYLGPNWLFLIIVMLIFCWLIMEHKQNMVPN